MTMTRTNQLRFGEWEGIPIRWTDTEGWCFNLRTRRWERIHVAECIVNGRLMTKEDYAHRFRNVDLPPLRRG